MIKLFTQVYFLFGDNRQKKINKERFIQIFKSMREPRWVMVEIRERNESRIILKNENGVVEYILVGEIEEIDKIDRLMADFVFDEYNGNY